jgi:CDP-diacylglycerol--serine O-phosphatidyltransferase
VNKKQIIPFSFTVAALVAGLFSILKSASGEYLAATQFIMLSMILDGMDGAAARLLKATSRFGAELDTFVDIISFGVAPAVLAYHIALQDFGSLGVIATSWIVLSGAMRLARFRVVDPHRGQHGYMGLPITVCAGWIAMSVFLAESGMLDPILFSLKAGPFAALVWMGVLIMLGLQISRLHYGKPTKELMVFIPCVFLVVLLFFEKHVAVAAAVAMMIFGAAYAFVSPFLPGHGFCVEDEEEESFSLGNS